MDQGYRWHRFSLIVTERGKYFLPLVIFPARRYIFRMDPSLNFSIPFCFLPSFFPPFSFFHSRPPLAFAFHLSVRHLERVYFRLVSKVNNVVYGLAYSASASHDANKSDASRKERTGRTRVKSRPIVTSGCRLHRSDN